MDIIYTQTIEIQKNNPNRRIAGIVLSAIGGVFILISIILFLCRLNKFLISAVILVGLGLILLIIGLILLKKKAEISKKITVTPKFVCYEYIVDGITKKMVIPLKKIASFVANPFEMNVLIKSPTGTIEWIYNESLVHALENTIKQ